MRDLPEEFVLGFGVAIMLGLILLKVLKFSILVG